ncbi:MAG: dihydroorotase, partial [Pseudobdellovibrionaceae bacterium]
MKKPFDLLITNAQTLVPDSASPYGLKETQINIGVLDGKIVDLAPSSSAEALKVFDARGLTVLPGLIDSQVHFREPGLEHKEDLQTGSRAAIMGGITTVFEMPNTNPSTTTAEALADKLKRAQGRMWCDHAFFVGGSHENADRTAELEILPGTPGIKIFMGSSTGSLLVEDDDTLARALKSGKRRVAIHSEDEYILRERKEIAVKSGDPKDHPIWRNVDSALSSTKRLIALAEKNNRPVHVLHISSDEEMEFLKNHKRLATVEVLPQHLTFFAPDIYEKLGTKAQQNPPIREKRHLEGLWKALRAGVVDVIGSDHAPHTLEEKSRPYPTSPSGMPMVLTTVPLMLTHVNAGKL